MSTSIGAIHYSSTNIGATGKLSSRARPTQPPLDVTAPNPDRKVFADLQEQYPIFDRNRDGTYDLRDYVFQHLLDFKLAHFQEASVEDPQEKTPDPHLASNYLDNGAETPKIEVVKETVTASKTEVVQTEGVAHKESKEVSVSV